MNVDISPYLPPSSSWTADAPIGSGSDGGGISVCRRSILRITEFFLDRTLSVLGCPLPLSVQTTPRPGRMSAMSHDPDEAGEMLRARGMRSTPQRRAILSVFAGGRTEHLAADEVYARATRLVPELSRGTVYATLAEFSELGLLSAFGTPEPVRYETNLEPHAHFRCHLCLRIFDLTGGQQNPADITDPGLRRRTGRNARRGDLRRMHRATTPGSAPAPRDRQVRARNRHLRQPGPPSRGSRARSDRCCWPRPRRA